jgi:hypothetical protein
MPLDSARATSKSFIFEEIKREYVVDPASRIPCVWQENNFAFTPPDANFLKAIPEFKEVIKVELRAGRGYYDVWLVRTDGGNPLNFSTPVGTIRKG